MIISFLKVHQDAKLPKQGKPGDAAFDLCCVETTTLEAGRTLAISTGLVLAEMPSRDHDNCNVFLHIVGRSSIALKGIFPIGGIVDANYRGEIKVILHNGSNVAHVFQAGDKIASVLVQKIATTDERNQVLMAERNDVIPTDRGDAGFGSTGR